APDQPRRRHHGHHLAPRAGAGAGVRAAHHRAPSGPGGPRRPARLAGPSGHRADLRAGRDRRRHVSHRGRWAGWVALVSVFVWSAVATEVSLGRTIEGLPFMWDFIRRMVPPDPSVLGNALRGAIQTVQIAIVGTGVAAVLALPLRFAAARNSSPVFLFSGARSLLNVFRP